MAWIGLTGGIGSGKSTVARMLAERGAHIIDADQLAREIVARGSDGLAEVVERFGDAVLTEDGDLDRAALAAMVFDDSDPAARRDLEAITHPRINALTAQRRSELPADAVAVHDIPLLVEMGLVDRYDLVVVVGASTQTRADRLRQTRGMSDQDIAARIAAQATDDERRAAADVWIDNDGTHTDLTAQVDDLWARIAANTDS